MERELVDWRHLLGSFDGRIGRRSFWIGLLILSAFSLLLEILIGAIFPPAVGGLVLKAVATLASLLLALPLGIKRLHDRDKSAWWLLMLLVPVVGLMWACAELLLFKGTNGRNRFGPDPLASPAIES